MQSAEWDEATRRIGTSTWSDALDHFGLSGVMRGLTWRSGTPPLVGRAVTVKEEVALLGTAPIEAFDVGAFIGAAGVGDVLVIDMGGAEVSTFGGLAARATAARNIAGVLIDGACRDLSDLHAIGLTVCSRHVTPTSGKQRARLVEINRRVECGGVSVESGDYVIGDGTGIVIVPAGRFDEVAAVAIQLDERDRRFEDALKSGQAFGSAVRNVGHV